MAVCIGFRKVATSPDQLGRTLSEGPGLQDTARGSWDLPEAASDQHDIVSQGPGTFRAVSEGPGTFRKQRQTIENDSKMTEIMKIVENGLILVEMG